MSRSKSIEQLFKVLHLDTRNDKKRANQLSVLEHSAKKVLRAPNTKSFL